MSRLAKKLAGMDQAAAAAATLLKALANEDRLLILCNLAAGEKNVTELQEILGLRQPTLSQQLSRLRYEGLVEFRRDGKSIHYRLASDEAAKIIELLYELYCAPVSRKGRDCQCASNVEYRQFVCRWHHHVWCCT